MNTKNFIQSLFILSALVSSSIAFGKGEDLKHHKSLNFEDRRVEALNQRPLDSLSQIGESDKGKKKNHLYDKPSHFKKETAESLEQMRYN